MPGTKPKPCCEPSEKILPIYQRIKNHLKKLISQGEMLHFKEGQVIFYDGHLPTGFFLLQEGRVSPEWFADNLLGLTHLLENNPYCITCKAATDVIIHFIPKATVLHFLKK